MNRPPAVRYCSPQKRERKCGSGDDCSSDGLCVGIPCSIMYLRCSLLQFTSNELCGKDCKPHYGNCGSSNSPAEPEQRDGRQNGNKKGPFPQCRPHSASCVRIFSSSLVFRLTFGRDLAQISVQFLRTANERLAFVTPIRHPQVTTCQWMFADEMAKWSTGRPSPTVLLPTPLP